MLKLLHSINNKLQQFNNNSSMDPLTLGVLGGSALISGISNFFSTKHANDTNLEIAKMNNEAAASMMRENNEFNRQSAIDMFNLENEYNDPSRAVERLRRAGINPAAILEGGAQVVNSGNASSPNAVGVPGLTTPYMQPLPSIASSALEAMATIAKASNDFASGNKSNADATRTQTLMNAELRKLFADARYADAQTSYTTLQENLDRLYEDDKRIGEIKQMAVDFTLAIQKGEFEKAHTEYMKAEKLLTDSKSEQVRQSTPIILDNLKKTGRAILAQANAANASAEASRASAQMSREQAETIRQNRPNVIAMTKASAEEKQAHADVAKSTTMQQIEHWKNTVKLDEKNAKMLDESIKKAKKDNDWYEVDKIIKHLDTIADDVLGFYSMGVSQMGRQTVVENYDSKGNFKGSTVSTNKYLYE